MGRNIKVGTKEIIAAIFKHNGNLAAAARSLSINRVTIWRRANGYPAKKMKADKKVADAIEESRETMLDEAESVLYQKVLEGEGWAVCFFLKTQGKRRGYIERQEVSGPEGGTILIRLDDGKDSEGAAKSV